MSCLVPKNYSIISIATRSIISKRYKTVTKAINREFRGSESETENSWYVGSYGRGTAVNTSDIDILVELPLNEYNRYESVVGNGQSRLLQAIRDAIKIPYPCSDVRADGQVVKITFSDDMKFEILPAFENVDLHGQGAGTYRYPDTNMGGNWCSTNPKAEQKAMKQKNISSNGLLYDTCKHFRCIRDKYYSSYHLSGIVIDSFIYAAMGNWRWPIDCELPLAARGDYERVLCDYLKQNTMLLFPICLTAPGSMQPVDTSSSMECLNKVMSYIAE